MTGKVKWFDDSKGYGFIETISNDPRGDVFVHYSNIECTGFKTIKPNQIVSFEMYESEDGKKEAKNVKVLL